jgi:hypothetical protein
VATEPSVVGRGRDDQDEVCLLDFVRHPVRPALRRRLELLVDVTVHSPGSQPGTKCAYPVPLRIRVLPGPGPNVTVVTIANEHSNNFFGRLGHSCASLSMSGVRPLQNVGFLLPLRRPSNKQHHHSIGLLLELGFRLARGNTPVHDLLRATAPLFNQPATVEDTGDQRILAKRVACSFAQKGSMGSQRIVSNSELRRTLPSVLRTAKQPSVRVLGLKGPMKRLRQSQLLRRLRHAVTAGDNRSWIFPT